MPVGFSISDELDIDYPGAIKDAQLERLKEAADVGFAWSQQQVPEDTGNLRRTAVEPQIKNDVVEWGYTAPYARPQEFGTGPYWPPARPLVEWAERVFGDGSIGYAVQQKIAEEGIEEKRFARAGQDRQEQWLQSHDLGDFLNDRLE